MKTACFINLPFAKKEKLSKEEIFFNEAYRVRHKKITGEYLKDVPIKELPEPPSWIPLLGAVKKKDYNLEEPPLWIPTLGAVLKDDYNLEVIDLSFFEKEDFTDEKIYSKLKSSKADFFLLSPMTIQYTMAKKIAAVIKKNFTSSKIIIGGAHATSMDEECLIEGFDAVVRGEGDITTPILLNNLSINKPLNDIEGISFIKKNTIFRTPNRPLIKNLDDLPIPEYNLLPKPYRETRTMFRIYCSRGCPYKCAFCANTIWNCKKPNYKSLNRIFEEMDLISSMMKLSTFGIGDETFTENKDFVTSFCKEIKKTSYDWVCQTRVNTVNEEILKLMYDSNCKEVSLGCESGVQKILDFNNKGTTVEQIEQAAKISRKVGLGNRTFWMCGLPGESRATALKTIMFMKKLIKNDLIDLVDYFICVPYPGTPIFNTPQKFKVKIKKDKNGSYNWDKFVENDLTVLSTEYLTNKEIYDLWKKGLYELAKVFTEKNK